MKVQTIGVLWGGVLLAACGGEPLDTSTCSRESGTICTVAGTGVAGDGQDGLFPQKTMLYAPADVAFSPDGALVVVDWNNHRIRMVREDGRLHIVAGEGELAEGLGDDDVTNRLNHPTDVTFDQQGRMVIAAWHNSRVKRVDLATGAIEDIVGTGARAFGGDGGGALQATLNLPSSVLYDPEGTLYISDQANQRIRCVDPSGMIRTIAGSGERGFAGDGGPASQASFKLPAGQRGHPAAHLARATDGTLYLADTENERIRMVSPAGIVSTVAGTGVRGSVGEGVPATQAELAGPVDVAIGPEGALYIADTENDCVRRIEGGVITTVAGTCGMCRAGQDPRCRCAATDAACLGDGGPAREARLKRPSGIAFDGQGHLFIADMLNHRIRVVYR